MASSSRVGLRIAEVVIVIFVMALLASLLLPTLSRSRELAKTAMMASRDAYVSPASFTEVAGGEPPPAKALAQVSKFIAVIDLTPRISVGTAAPESIYEAKFSADLAAVSPAPGRMDCEVQLPLPPQIISLSDLIVSVNGEPSDNVRVRDGMLIWAGQLDSGEPANMKVTYTAMGKGIYTLNRPPGKIVDEFETTLTARNTNVQMLQLSLQPVERNNVGGDTVYKWKYKRLMLARPIQIDVLGIAPMDRLGELTWLGPASIVIFGILVSLVAMAFYPEKLDKWMLLLIIGTFTGAYPLMYFAQEFMSLGMAVMGACIIVLALIGLRAVTLMGTRVGILGVVALAGAIQALTVWATVQPALQGVLLTILIITGFVLAMVLLPKAQRSMSQLAQSRLPMPAPAAPPAQ